MRYFPRSGNTCLSEWCHSCSESFTQRTNGPSFRNPLNGTPLLGGHERAYILLHYALKAGDRGSVAGMATRYVQDGSGSAHPTFYITGTGSLLGVKMATLVGWLVGWSLGVKRPGRGVNQTPHLVPKLKKE